MPHLQRPPSCVLNMARIIYTNGFIEDLSFVYSDKVLNDIRKALDAIETFPNIGSSDIPQSVVEDFGSNVRKAIVKPFDLVYEYDEPADTVIVYGLVPFRRAR